MYGYHSDVKRLCKAVDCDVRFLPKFARQTYHDPRCRERTAARRAEERKVERALEDARSGTHKDHLPSAYLPRGTTRVAKVLADIRFEMEEDARAGTPQVLQARVRSVATAARSGERNILYGTLVLMAASAASWAIRLDAPVSRMRRPTKQLRSAT